jgi:hypothetical protein
MVKSAMVTKKGNVGRLVLHVPECTIPLVANPGRGITDVRNKVIVRLSSTAAFGKGAKASRYHGHPSARHDA